MPYLITVKRQPPLRAQIANEPEWEVLSQRAVATLEDARKAAGLTVGQSGGKVSDWVRYYDEAAAIKPGEMMGPLPDGTVIGVELSTWPWLATDHGLGETVLGHMAASGVHEAQESILTAFNEAQAGA